ncbi:MAG TPA: tetratricopeptide repeat protein [Chloroflexi bacterium]|nr:tetratricopeptide repeat protein [Chloroflexota bacterium]
MARLDDSSRTVGERPPSGVLLGGLFALLLALLMMACTATAEPETNMRLPTRILRTSTPTATVTLTPFPIPAQAYYEEGLARQAGDDLEGALQSFNWALQRDPAFVPAYVARGTIYLNQGQPRRARAEAQAALVIAPQFVPALVLEGESLRAIGKPALAVDAFRRAVELEPSILEEVFRSYWLAAQAADDTTRMVALGREYGKLHPDDPLRHYYRAWPFIAMDGGNAAIKILVQGIETSPDPPALLWFALGTAYIQEQVWPDAVTALETARILVQTGDTSLALHSDRPVADLFLALGRAYLGVGRCVDAEVMLRYAVDIGASSEMVAEWLEAASMCQTPTPTVTPYLTATPG